MTTALLLEIGKSYLFVFAAILPILNPAATAPIFLSLTPGASQSTRTLLAKRIGRNMFLLMAGAMLVGSVVLEFFGLSLPIVRVSGGLIVAAAAWRMLSASSAEDDNKSSLARTVTPEVARKQAFYPLTFPISCGPGSIAAAITVGASQADERLMVNAARMSGALLALASIGLVLYLVLRYAEQVLKPLGETGTIVFMRLSAFILLCVGVQIVWDGFAELFVKLAMQP